ncbi:MAG: type IV-A pilus assembly ATPase PilB [Gammaproteobacteria bacterium]|nr:MAG: type IV-A pilus assembly ATPase PilB [Gammaproteobacteria bacterium]
MPTSYAPIISAIAQQLGKEQGLTVERLRQYHAQSLIQQRSFLHSLVDDQVIDAHQLLKLIQTVSHCPLIDLSAVSIDKTLIQAADAQRIRKHQILPIFRRGDRLFVVTFDPFYDVGLNMFKFRDNGQYAAVEPILAMPEQIERYIDRCLSAHQAKGLQDLFLDDMHQEDQTQQALSKLSQQLMGQFEKNEAPVVRYVSEMLLTAIRTNASDIHFEPYENHFRVRFRRDGLLTEVSTPPSRITNRITTRLKVMSGMDIAEKRIPQDGRIQVPVSGQKSIDFRVSSLPTLWGEKVVLRILDNRTTQLSIDDLGFTAQQKSLYLDAIKKPQGIILVTGPTGSGKTVSMYAGLNLINKPSVNISTAEDPVEITLPGINQVNIAPKQGLTFASALRAFLRQDPDIIMVGEIRDLETAEIAVKAAQTGHLVFSTLHTNDVPQTLTRLANMGVPAYNIAASVELIMAQRLIRCLCTQCKVRDRSWKIEQLIQLGLSPDEAENNRLYKAKGCDHCNQTGYSHRTGIFQVIRITTTMTEMIMRGATSLEFAAQCRREGFWDLRQSGLDKARQGITSLAEVIRVTIE